MLEPVNCPNRAINLQMCPCPNTECERRGICCLCVQAHHRAGKPTACMGGRPRPAATLELRGVVAQCTVRFADNLAFCPCGAESCVRRGTCCECVRNHWTADGAGRVACMRGLA